MLLLGRAMVCSHRLSIQTIVSGTDRPQFAIQVLTGVYGEGVALRRKMKMGPLISPAVTSYRLPSNLSLTVFAVL